jgi:hypothetical protein
MRWTACALWIGMVSCTDRPPPQLEILESYWVRYPPSGAGSSGRMVLDSDRVTASYSGGPWACATLTAEGRRQLDEALAQFATDWSPPYLGPTAAGSRSDHRLLRDGAVDEFVVHDPAREDQAEIVALSDVAIRITAQSARVTPGELVVPDASAPCPAPP